MKLMCEKKFCSLSFHVIHFRRVKFAALLSNRKFISNFEN